MTSSIASRPSLRGLANGLARESLLVVSCATFLGMAAILVPQQLSSDGWLALVAGRSIVSHGLPHRDSLAALTTGRAWVDQQWLGQLAAYGLETLGGVRLLLAANVALVVGSFVAACIYARRAGAHPTTVGVVALLALLPLLAATMTVRTQSFVYLPFVFLVAVLVRRNFTGLRVLGALALLVLWANVHGSALLAAGLVVLRGALDLRESVGSGRAKAWVTVLAPFLCVFVSPYHVHLASYYATTAFDPAFAKYLVQWAPTRFSPLAAPLLVLLVAVVWMLGRGTVTYTLYERCLLVLAVLLGLTAVRQWAFSGLLILMVAPAGFDQTVRRQPARAASGLGAVIAVVVAGTALAGIVGALCVPSAKLTSRYPATAADVAARAAGPGKTVYASEEFADWLLWERPELAGRVAFDVRYELLQASEVRQIVLFDLGSGVDRPLTQPDVFVLDPKRLRHAVDGLRPTVRTVYKTDHAMVVVGRDDSR